MDTSDNPGFRLRNTSLTIRLRFTPAMACSTRTRIRPSRRLARFSPSVSSRPRGFFFRPAGPRHRGLIALEPGALVQGGPRRVPKVGLVGDALVIGRAGVGRAEEQDPCTAGADHHHVLVGVGLPLAAVVQRLFFGLFGPLPAPLGAVDDDDRGRAGPTRRSSSPTTRAKTFPPRNRATSTNRSSPRPSSRSSSSISARTWRPPTRRESSRRSPSRTSSCSAS